MDKKEAEFQANLLAMFKIEAEEHLKTISDGLIALESGLPDEERKKKVESIFREAHSLKGAARSVNYESIQSICQSLENVFSAWKQGKLRISKDLFDTLYATNDLIGKLISLPPAEKLKDGGNLYALIERLDQLIMERQETPTPVSQEKPKIAPILPQKPQPTLQPSQQLPEKQPASSEAAEKELPKKAAAQPAQTHALSPAPNQESPRLALAVQNQEKTIRVSLTKLDTLFQEVEEMLMLKLAARQQMNNLRSLQEKFKQSDKQWKRIQSDIHTLEEWVQNSKEAQNSHRDLLTKAISFINFQQQFIKSIKDQVTVLFKMSAQDYRTASGTVDSLLDDTRKVLMQPFSTLLDAFPRMVRDIAHSQGKEVQFEIIGGDIEIDKRILEEIKDPLMHLIRNSIDHGIEQPDVRVKMNKPSKGTIRVSAAQVSGNSMEVIISDDGRGINRDKVKDSAIKQGVLNSSDAALLGDHESLMLIFQSGISTTQIITDLSGRGLGLGIVAEKVDKLGGQVSVESKLGEGTSFRIVLPLTLATFRGMQIRVSGQDFIMPSHNIKRVIQIAPEKIRSVENREIILQDGKTIAFVPLSQVLELSSSNRREKNQKLFAVIVKAAEKMIAFEVDNILHEQEVLVKGLGPQLIQIKNIMGASISESGQVIAILNPQDLVKTAIKLNVVKRLSSAEKDREESKKVILIAEDSMTSRLLLKNILETAGYEVKAAVDGFEAFSIFKLENVDLIVSDVEMPRMDGFTLTAKIRELDKGKRVPIVLCTAQESPEDREHGIEVGANAYLGKSQFTQKTLIDIIQKFL